MSTFRNDLEFIVTLKCGKLVAAFDSLKPAYNWAKKRFNGFVIVSAKTGEQVANSKGILEGDEPREDLGVLKNSFIFKKDKNEKLNT